MLYGVRDTVVMVMAGGKGSRLGPLTCHRSKPAVPFAGRYRIIDFVLSNFINSGYRRIYVLTQYMASSLIKHLNTNWRLSGFGEFIEVVPAQMRLGEFWYRGTADAVLQNLNLVRDAGCEHVAVFGGDHIYKCAIDQMEEQHRRRQADLTVGAFPVPRHEATGFGCIQVDGEGRITGFVEKPADPPGIPGRPDWALASMGNYIFRTDVMMRALMEDAEDPASRHDFGRDVIPRLLAQGKRVHTYDFGQNRIPGEGDGSGPYWRDVGTLDSYYQANMDVRARLPSLNMYNRAWRIRSSERDYPPARFVREEGCPPATIEDSLVAVGSIIASAHLREVLVGYDCFVHARSTVEESVITSGCDIGAGARVRRVVLDKNCHIDANAVVGHDPEADRRRFPFITEGGIIVLPKGSRVPAEGPIQLAFDIHPLLLGDPEWGPALEAVPHTVSDRGRHSYISAGPRYKMFAGSPVADEAE
jgi:glucose-1-phosphate adenylyltransferase